MHERNFKTIITNPNIQIHVLENGSLMIRDVIEADVRKYLFTCIWDCDDDITSNKVLMFGVVFVY